MIFSSLRNFVLILIGISFLIIESSCNNGLYPSVCGLKFKNKVIGGAETEANTWPWMVSLQYNYEHICGGTLIHNQFVLTAAHCILHPNSAGAYKVILGGHNITNSGVYTSAVRVGITKLIVHEDFYRWDFINDVALLKLAKPVEFTREIFPACMPQKTDNFENTTCYFAGWGLTYNSGSVPNTPKEISLPILSEAECEKYVRAAVEQKYCSGAMASYQDTCKGDSGSGQMCEKKDGLWYVAGVVSYGVGACGNVGIQARVDYQRDWIDRIITENL